MSTGLIINGSAKGSVTVTLQDINTLTGSDLTFPASWASLSISDVITSINTGTEDYSLSFTAFGNIDLPGLPNLSMNSARFTLTASKPKTGGWDYGISFNGMIEISDDVADILISVDGAFERTGDAIKTDTWSLTATTEKAISLNSLFNSIDATLSLGSYVSTTGTIQKLQLTAKHIKVGTATATTSYSAEIDFNWNFKLFDDINLGVDNAIIKIAKDTAGTLTGSASGSTTIPHLNAQVEVKFDLTSTGGKDISIIWEDITATYTSPNDTVTLTVTDWNVGKSIVSLAKLVGDENFQLDSPWDLLNDIVIKELDIIFNFKNKDVSLTVDFESGIDLLFISINGFTLSRVKVGANSEILMRLNADVIDGIDTSGAEWQNILGKSTSTGNAKKGQSINNMPKVPGKGNKYLDVEYLGLGQKVTLQNTTGLKTVESALAALATPFNAAPKDGEPFPSDSLEFNGDNSWLVGTQLTIIDAIELGFIFDDPDLYGLLIKINNKKKSLKAFSGLKFEILYKKISSTIGMYYIELKLPTEMRHLQFGEVAVTLPVLYLNIYTNGNFKIDLGYPKSLRDFSDSLTIQAFPFTGSGGFYFAVLDDATAKDLPQTNMGTFHPVIEFGFALNFGLGKSINKGILKAGISVVVVGALQGTLAWFHPKIDNDKSDLYYKLMGTVGIVGKVYGSINFAIVQASVSLVVSAMATTVLQSYSAIPIKLVAKVTAHAEASIDCGFFTIHLGFSFTTSIKENLTIGSSHLNEAPWYNTAGSHSTPTQALVHQSYFKRFMNYLITPVHVFTTANWQALVAPRLADKEKLQFYFVPQLTLTDVSTATPEGTPEYVAMVYIDTPAMDKSKKYNTSGTTSFEKLAQGIFAWMINSLNGVTGETLEETLATKVSISELKEYLLFLEDTSTLFTTADIMNFLQSEFDLYLASPDQAKGSFTASNLSAALFPVFPELKMDYTSENMSLVTSAPSSTTVQFNEFAMAKPAYLKFMETYFSELATAYEKNNGGNSQGTGDAEPTTSLSIADYVFQDYFLMIAKALLQNGIDYIQTFKVNLSSAQTLPPNSISDASSLNDIVTKYTNISSENLITVEQIAQQNGNTKIGYNKEVVINGYKIESNQSFTASKLCEKFDVTINNFAEANYFVQGIYAVDSIISYTDYTGVYTYKTLAIDSLDSIITSLKATARLTKISASAILSQNISYLNDGVSFVIPNILYAITSSDTPVSILKKFLTKVITNGSASYIQGIASPTSTDNLEVLLNTNCLTPGLIKVGTSLTVTSKTYIVVENDTVLNIITQLNCTMTQLATQLILTVNNSCLSPNQSIIIPSIGYTTPALAKGVAEQTDLTTISHAYNVSLADLAFSNETLAGIFTTEQSINVPNLTTLYAKDISTGILENQDIANQANLGSRVFLHGLQLPITADITYGNGNTPVINTTESVYTLTGQQIPIEYVNSNFKIALSNYGSIKPGLISAVGSAINFIPNTKQIDFITSMKTAARTLDFNATYTELKAYKEIPVHFALGKTTNWKYPGNLFTGVTSGYEQLNICRLPDSFIHFVNKNSTDPSTLTLNKVTQNNPTYDPTQNQITELKWSTSVKIEIKELPHNGSESSKYYELIGVSHTEVFLLEQLLISMEATSDLIDEIHLLYRPETQNKKPKGYQSATLSKQQTIITQADLSGFESLITSGTYTAASHEGSGTLNTNEEFVKLLLQASVARNGGYYLYYNDETTGKGIPSNVFNQKEIGEINLIITYNTLTPIPKYVNSMIADVPALSKNAALYIESTDHSKPASVLPVGNYGFEVSRDNTMATGPVTTSNFLLQNFSLLGYNMPSSITDFHSSQSGLPISPKVESFTNSAKSIYEHVLPLYKFAKTINTGLAGSAIAGINMAENPYNGLGKTATIDFNWVDLFGNNFNKSTQGAPFQLTMNYRDEIIGLNQLPGLGIHYEIVSGVLNLNLSFSTARYNTGSKNKKDFSAGKALSEQDLYTYISSYYQMVALFNNNLATTPLTITNTLDNTPFDVTAADIYELYNAIILYLQKVKALTVSTVLPDPIITPWVCNTISVNSSSPIFELDVTIVIERDPSLVDPDFSHVKHVNKVIASIKPDTGEASNGATGSLKAFVTKLESSYNITGTKKWYKVAIGDDKTDLSVNIPAKKIWIVQFGEGMIDFDITSAKPLFYAPVPLANSVVNLNDLKLKSYSSVSGLSAASTVPKSFASVNLDKWASSVLTAIDDFLLPEFAIPANMIGSGVIETIPVQGVNQYQRILNIKKQLADCISKNIAPIEGVTPPEVSTKTKFKEELLQKLSTAYDVEAIVQNPVTVKLTTSGNTNIKLFGKPVNSIANSIPNYSLSTTEIDIDDSKLTNQNLVYLLTLKGPAIEESLDLNLQFSISNIQHQIVTESNLGSNEIGSWLSFVEPITGEQLDALNFNVKLGFAGSTKVPLLMRSYPTPPSILGQTFITEPPVDNTSLVDLLKWDYVFTYTSITAEQDESIIDINYNVADSKTKGNSIPTTTNTLPIGLANFISLYPAIKTDFITALTKINPATQSTDANYIKANLALKAFATLIENVATQWATWAEIILPSTVPSGASSYVLKETPATKTLSASNMVNALKVTIETTTGASIIPTVSIPDSPYTPENVRGEATGFFIDTKNKYLKYSDRNKYPQRKLTFTGLSLLEKQNAWAGVSIVRNKYLFQQAQSKSPKTNTDFIYQTPLVRQKNALTPFLIQGKGINIAKIDFTPPVVSSAKLGDYLNALLLALFPDSTIYDDLALKFQCSYSYSQSKDGTEEIVLPIVLTTPYKFKKPNSKGNKNIKQLGEHIAAWVVGNNLTINTAENATIGPYHYNGQLKFKLEMYSNKNVHTPIAMIDDLFLYVGSINW